MLAHARKMSLVLLQNPRYNFRIATCRAAAFVHLSRTELMAAGLQLLQQLHCNGKLVLEQQCQQARSEP
jgi:hypothetical protein